MNRMKLWNANQYLLLGILVIVVLYYARTMLIPIVFGALLAMLMAPVCNFLDGRGWKRTLSTTVCISILLVVLLFMLGIIVIQVSSFAEELPKIERRADQFLNQIQSYIQREFNVSPEKQLTFAKNQVKSLGESAGKQVGDVVGSVTAAVAGLLLTLVYTFLFLYQKEKYERFVLRLYKEEETEKIKDIVSKISNVSQQYLTGRAISVLILAVLYSIGLVAVGLKNALLLAGIASLLTIIPYVGTFIGGLFPVLMALVTEDSLDTALWVTGILVFIQTVDNYFIEPYIVGGEVHLSALASIVIIIAGGFIWGVPGMILFIPMLAIAKIIFDHVDGLKPYGYLIGDNKKSAQSKLRNWITRKSQALIARFKKR